MFSFFFFAFLTSNILLTYVLFQGCFVGNNIFTHTHTPKYMQRAHMYSILLISLIQYVGYSKNAQVIIVCRPPNFITVSLACLLKIFLFFLFCLITFIQFTFAFICSLSLHGFACFSSYHPLIVKIMFVFRIHHLALLLLCVCV